MSEVRRSPTGAFYVEEDGTIVEERSGIIYRYPNVEPDSPLLEIKEEPILTEQRDVGENPSRPSDGHYE